MSESVAKLCSAKASSVPAVLGVWVRLEEDNHCVQVPSGHFAIPIYAPMETMRDDERRRIDRRSELLDRVHRVLDDCTVHRSCRE